MYGAWDSANRAQKLGILGCSLAGVPPTPFDAGRFALFGQPVFKEDVFDDGAGAVVELAGNDLDEAHQGIAAFDWDRPDQLTRRGGKQLVAERGFGLAALDQGEKTRFGG